MRVFQVEYTLRRRQFKFYIYIEDVDTTFNSQQMQDVEGISFNWYIEYNGKKTEYK